MSDSLNVNLLFFASLRENLSCSSLSTHLPQGSTVDDVVQWLISKGGVWKEQFTKSEVIAALNHEVCSMEQIINHGDELAFFPPVTGG